MIWRDSGKALYCFYMAFILSTHGFLFYNAGLYSGKVCQNYEYKVR